MSSAKIAFLFHISKLFSSFFWGKSLVFALIVLLLSAFKKFFAICRFQPIWRNFSANSAAPPFSSPKRSCRAFAQICDTRPGVRSNMPLISLGLKPKPQRLQTESVAQGERKAAVVTLLQVVRVVDVCQPEAIAGIHHKVLVLVREAEGYAHIHRIADARPRP